MYSEILLWSAGVLCVHHCVTLICMYTIQKLIDGGYSYYLTVTTRNSKVPLAYFFKIPLPMFAANLTSLGRSSA